jgi:hypothetical protein
MKSWIVQVTVMVVMLSVGSTALAQMGKRVITYRERDEITGYLAKVLDPE